MEITWYGLSCFRLSERGYASVVTDPFDASVGLAPPRLRADVVTISHEAAGHNNSKAVSGVQHVLTGPGEYEIGGVFITGISTPSADNVRNVIYLYNFANLTVAHFGDVASVPSQSQIEALGTVNVLLVPVGGGSSLNAVQAAELVSLVEPNYVVPMHFATPGVTLPLEDAARFLKEMGAAESETDNTLRVTAGSLPEETVTVLLAPRL